MPEPSHAGARTQRDWRRSEGPDCTTVCHRGPVSGQKIIPAANTRSSIVSAAVGSAIEELSNFCHQADQLRNEPLVRAGWDNSFSLRFDRTAGLRTVVRQPNETALRSLLLALRRFVAQGEPVHLDRLYNVCETAITSDRLRAFLRDARDAWKRAQRANGLKLVVNGKEISPCDVADMWINGHYFHSDPAKRARLAEVSVTPLNRFQFISFVGDALQQTLYMDSIVRHALRDGLVKE